MGGRCPVPGNHPSQSTTASRWVSTWIGDCRFVDFKNVGLLNGPLYRLRFSTVSLCPLAIAIDDMGKNDCVHILKGGTSGEKEAEEKRERRKGEKREIQII